MTSFVPSSALRGLARAMVLSLGLSGVAVSGAVAQAAAPATRGTEESQLVIHTRTGSYDFTVEVVDTAESRARGLMYRLELADDAGMLFDFIEERPVSFWMRHTFIPLDMIFIGADGVVRNVHANAVPHDETGIPSDGPVRFVLEIPGGRAAALGLVAGDTIEHPRIGS